MNKEKLKKIFSIIFMLFIILQPIFDIFYLYTDSIISIFKFSPSTIIRMIVMILLFITSFIWYRDKRKYNYFIIFFVIFILYSIFHHNNALIFNSEYGNFKYSTIKEFFYLIRMLMPLLMIFITYEKNPSEEKFKKVVITTSLIFSIIMIVTNIFEVAITSYNNGTGIIKANIFEWFNKETYIKYGYEFVASKGIFHMANQISATLLVLLPLNIYYYFKSKKILNIITIFLIVISMLMLGTRVASYGSIFILIAMLIIYLFFEIYIEKNKICKKKIFYFVLVMISSIIILPYSPVSNRTYISDEASTVTESVSESKFNTKYKQFIEEIKELEKVPGNEKIIQDKKEKFVEKYYKLLLIDENYILNIYPYTEDTDFWIEEMQKPFLKRANHRQLKTNITKRVITLNDNKSDYIWGVSFTRLRNALVYMENDIFVHIYSIGIIGILIFIFPYLYIVLYALYKMFKYKENFNFLNITIIMSVILVFAAGLFSGNVFDEWIVTLFLGIISGMLLLNLKKRDKKRVLFISSTGGHLSELLELNPLFNKYDSHLITEKTKSTMSLRSKYKKVNYLVFGTKDHKFTYIFKFMWNCFKSIWFYILIRPDVIVTTGTHTAVPMCYIGKLFGSKIIFIETFANSDTKTLSGRIVYPIADTFIVQWESMLKLYPKAVYGGWIY